MKGLLLCNRGIEDIASLEVKEILGKDAKINNGFVEFKFDKKEDLCRLAYLSQSIKKALFVLDSIDFKNEEDIINKAKKIDFSDWLNEKTSFKVNLISDNEKISQEYLKGEIGATIIKNMTKYRQKVSLDAPDITTLVFINKNTAYYCIDFSGIDLSKREYRIFSSSKNIKSTIAYAMIRLSDYKKGEALMDPFCLSGTIPIETSLFLNNFSNHFFSRNSLIFTKFMKFDFEEIDKKRKEENNIFALDSQFKNVDFSRKNAKIAGINKTINFSRMEVEWLDTKFDKGKIDRIVTRLPNIGKFGDKNTFMKMYREFFYQSDFILNKKGACVVCTLNPAEIKEAASEKGFKITHKRDVWQGKEKLFILKFIK